VEMKWLYKIEGAFLMVSIAAATLVLFVNIVLRYFFGSNTTWAYEFIRYAMIWITFIGASVCFGKGMHVGIDFFVEYLSPRIRKIVAIFIYLVSLLLMVFLVRYGWELVRFSMQTGQITPSLQIKMYWVYLAIPVGAVLSIIHIIENMISQFRSANNNNAMEGNRV